MSIKLGPWKYSKNYSGISNEAGLSVLLIPEENIFKKFIELKNKVFCLEHDWDINLYEASSDKYSIRDFNSRIYKQDKNNFKNLSDFSAEHGMVSIIYKLQNQDIHASIKWMFFNHVC